MRVWKLKNLKVGTFQTYAIKNQWIGGWFKSRLKDCLQQSKRKKGTINSKNICIISVCKKDKIVYFSDALVFSGFRIQNGLENSSAIHFQIQSIHFEVGWNSSGTCVSFNQHLWSSSWVARHWCFNWHVRWWCGHKVKKKLFWQNFLCVVS